jgi:hypothetical protein
VAPERSKPSDAAYRGVLKATAADDREGQARLSAFQQGLQQVGGTDGRNALIDTR